MAKRYAVIGAGFGDEGKGLAVDFLCRKIHREEGVMPVVVRHNGTAQASHTVVDGPRRHRFSHFGSGTLYGAPTYLADTFYMHPCALVKEIIELMSLGVAPRVLYDRNCPVIFPQDIALSILRETRSGNGTCGMGMYAAFERGEKKQAVTIGEILDSLKDGLPLEMVTQAFGVAYDGYYKEILDALGISTDEMKSELEQHRLIERFLRGISVIYAQMTCVPWENMESDHLVFEGAQGLRLDPRYGVMPHCTPSDCGLHNPVNLLKRFQEEETKIDVLYITRTYSSRHGRGPLENAHTPNLLNNNIYIPGLSKSGFEIYKMDSNSCNEYQGAVRYAPLDRDGMLQAITADFDHAIDIDLCVEGPSIDLEAGLFVTWGDVLEGGAEEALRFCSQLGKDLDTAVEFLSIGPEAKHVLPILDVMAEMERAEERDSPTVGTLTATIVGMHRQLFIDGVPVAAGPFSIGEIPSKDEKFSLLP
jgi:adenylosuccinate synthase